MIDLDVLVKDLPLLVPAQDAAAFLGIGVRTLRSWVASERIEAFKLHPGRPGRVLVPRSEIKRILEQGAR